MKTKWTAILIAAALLTSGCVMTREQIREGATPGEGQSEISQMQVKRAEEVARMDELEESVRLLRGEVEVAQNQITQMEQAKQAAASEAGEQQAMSSKSMEQRLVIFEEALRSFETKLVAMSAEIQKLKSRPAAKAASATKPKAESVGNYGGAQKSFDQKSWKQAIVGYEKYRELNPKGRRYADATYKIGVCFQELGMKTEAKAFYEEVIAKYPKSNTAKKAKYRLSQVK